MVQFERVSGVRFIGVSGIRLESSGFIGVKDQGLLLLLHFQVFFL